MTAFGEGTIQGFVDSEEGPRYRVKLPFGIGSLQPYAILHNVDAKDGSRYIRRGDEMIKEVDNDPVASERSDAASSVVVNKKFQVLFGSDSIYLFLRLYGILISLLNEIAEYLSANPTNIDPSLSYYNPMKSADDKQKEEYKLDYAALILKLHEVIDQKVNLKDFESFARLVNKDIVYKMAALPKLILRCGDMMIKMSEENLLPRIFDICQYSGQNPVDLRSTCIAISPAAEYRIQYNSSNGRLYFSYLPEGEELSKGY